MISAPTDASAFARTLMWQAAWPPLALAGATIAFALAPADPQQASPALIVGAGLMAAAAALTMLALSLHLAFDALLFRLIASHDSEDAGCADVDDILARMRLKQRPAVTRGLAERIAGTRRVVRRQRAAFAAFSLCTLLFGLARGGMTFGTVP